MASASALALVRAFDADPMFVLIEPDADCRRRVLPWFFDRSCRLGDRYGRVDRHGGVAAAIRLTPGAADLGARQLVGSGLVLAQMRFGPAAFRRFTALTSAFEAAGRRSDRGSRYWYLLALGVAPAQQGHGIGTALVTPALQQAERQGEPCSLETLAAADVPVSERLGFHVAEHVTASGLPPLWTMLRPPRSRGQGTGSGSALIHRLTFVERKIRVSVVQLWPGQG